MLELLIDHHASGAPDRSGISQALAALAHQRLYVAAAGQVAQCMLADERLVVRCSAHRHVMTRTNERCAQCDQRLHVPSRSYRSKHDLHVSSGEGDHASHLTGSHACEASYQERGVPGKPS